jgi:DNA-binding CsgD family transcriptional regulator
VYFLILFAVFGFFNFVGRYLAENVLNELAMTPHTVNSMGVIFNFLAWPFLFAGWYMFILMLRELLGKGISPLFKWFYLFYNGTVAAVIAILIEDYISRKQEQLSAAASLIILIVNILGVFLIYLTILHTYFQVKSIKDKQRQRVIKNFGYLYLALFSAYFLVNYSIQSKQLYFIIMPMLHFSLNLPPLLYLAHAFKKFDLDPLPPVEAKEFEKFYARYNISRREREIIQLICQGKSNKEIEDILFISLQTVKHHIYNIYKKLGVKNRVHLVNLLRVYADKK